MEALIIISPYNFFFLFRGAYITNFAVIVCEIFLFHRELTVKRIRNISLYFVCVCMKHRQKGSRLLSNSEIKVFQLLAHPQIHFLKMSLFCENYNIPFLPDFQEIRGHYSLIIIFSANPIDG